MAQRHAPDSPPTGGDGAAHQLRAHVVLRVGQGAVPRPVVEEPRPRLRHGAPLVVQRVRVLHALLQCAEGRGQRMEAHRAGPHQLEPGMLPADKGLVLRRARAPRDNRGGRGGEVPAGDRQERRHVPALLQGLAIRNPHRSGLAGGVRAAGLRRDAPARPREKTSRGGGRSQTSPPQEDTTPCAAATTRCGKATKL